MTHFAGFTPVRRLVTGLLPLMGIIACDSPLDVPPPGSQPPAHVPVAAIEIQAPAGELEVGQLVALSAHVLAADGAVLERPLTWASSDSLVVSVSAAGVLTARASGTAQVTARNGSISAQVAITVRQSDAVAFIEIEVPFTELSVGQTGTLMARVRSANGTLLHREVAWTSNDPAVATIAGDGVLTARGAGQVIITASAEGREGTAIVSVRAGATALVTGLLPASAQAGSPGFELTIRGTGFEQGATVRIGAEERPARVLSSTEIRIDIGADDIRQPGGFEVRVSNPGQALGSNIAYFTVERVASTLTYDLLGSAHDDAGLPVLTGGFFYVDDVPRWAEQFVTAGVLRIHQPATGPDTWDMNLTMETRSREGEVLKEEDLVFFGTVEWPAPGGQMALRSDMFPNLVLHTVAYVNGELVVYQTLHPSGDPIHEQAWRYRPRQ
jgi:hypothetical protein